MNIFKKFENEMNYEDILQLDGAFSVVHINYGKSPHFNGIDGKDMSKDSLKNSLLSEEKVENVFELRFSFDGTEKDFKMDDRILIWRNYWIEYMIAFEKLVNSLPNSVVTIYIGRQAIEIGFKYLLLMKTRKIIKTHDLEKLSNLFFSEYEISDSYMTDVDSFCRIYCQYIEGENVEYFRFPEYKENKYFAGNRLDINWLSYNFILILMKLTQFSNLENEM